MQMPDLKIELPELQTGALLTSEQIEVHGVNHRRSPDLSAFALAMARVQQKITPAKLDSYNPYHSSRYASMSSIWQVLRAALEGSELAVMQFPNVNNDASIISVETFVVHSSGQFVACDVSARIQATDEKQGEQGGKAKNLSGVQRLGGAITYLRRYGLSAVFCLVTEEDHDGNEPAQRRSDQQRASQRPPQQQQQAPAKPTEKKLPAPKCSSAKWGEFHKLFTVAQSLKINPEDYLARFDEELKSRNIREFDDATIDKACLILQGIIEAEEERLAVEAEAEQTGGQQ